MEGTNKEKSVGSAEHRKGSGIEVQPIEWFLISLFLPFSCFFKKIFIYFYLVALVLVGTQEIFHLYCGRHDFFFFSCGHVTLSCGMWDLVPWPRIRPTPLLWECRVLATGPPGNSSRVLLKRNYVLFWTSLLSFSTIHFKVICVVVVSILLSF